MNVQEYVDGLFTGYPNSGAMADFKAEASRGFESRRPLGRSEWKSKLLTP